MRYYFRDHLSRNNAYIKRFSNSFVYTNSSTGEGESIYYNVSLYNIHFISTIFFLKNNGFQFRLVTITNMNLNFASSSHLSLPSFEQNLHTISGRQVYTKSITNNE